MAGTGAITNLHYLQNDAPLKISVYKLHPLDNSETL